MKIRFKKKSERESTLAVIRPDGSFTGDQLRSGGFGAIHDLTHFVVEQTLGMDCGFFGLLARGWNIQDFDNRGSAASIPDDSIMIECLVGQLTNIVMRGPEVDVAGFNCLVSQAVIGMRLKSIAPQLTAEEFSRLREKLGNLLRDWEALPVGETLELNFSILAAKVAAI